MEPQKPYSIDEPLIFLPMLMNYDSPSDVPRTTIIKTQSVGSGLNDFNVKLSSAYTLDGYHEYLVTIATAATPDTFDWTKDGSGGASGVSITGDWQTLGDNIQIRFLATTGHTATDAFRIRVMPHALLYLDNDGNLAFKRTDGTSNVVTTAGDDPTFNSVTIDTTLDVTGASTFADTLTIGTDKELFFRDTGLFIHSSADGKLLISSDGVGADDITLSGTVTFDDNILIPTDKKILIRDTGLFIHSTADGKLLISSDGVGADDITLSGTVTLDDDLLQAAAKKILFRDSALSLNSSVDGQLDAAADVKFKVTSPTFETSAAATITGALTPTGGVAAAGGFSASARNIHVGGAPAKTSGEGTDATPVVTEVYIGEIFVPANCTATGVSIMLGSATNGNAKVGLADSAGAVIATSASTDISSATVDAYARIPFTAPEALVGPATYFVLAMFDDNTNRFNAHAFGDFGAAKQEAQVYATGFTTITPPTTFTADLAPIASLYTA